MVYCLTNLLLEPQTETAPELPECLGQWGSVLSQLPSLWFPELILWSFSFVPHPHETNRVVKVNKTVHKRDTTLLPYAMRLIGKGEKARVLL